MTDPRLSNDDLVELASAYLDGEATPTERAQVEANPTAMEIVARYRNQAQRFAEPFPEPAADVRTAAIGAALGAFEPRGLVSLSTDTSAPAEADYTVETASIVGLPEAVDNPDDSDDDPTTISTTAAPNDTSLPHRPISNRGNAGRGRRRWLQKISPAAAALAALVAIIGGVGIYNLTQSDGERVTATASPGSAYAEDALDASVAGEDASAEVLARDASASDSSDAKRTTEGGDTAGAEADTDGDVMSDQAMSEEDMADDATADEGMADDAMADDGMADGAISEGPSARDEETKQNSRAAGSSDSFDTGRDEAATGSSATDGQGDFGADFGENNTDSDSSQGSPANDPATRPAQNDDADFAFAESDSLAPFEPGSASSSGSGSNSTGSDGESDAGSDSSIDRTSQDEGTTGGDTGSSGGGTNTSPVALDLRTDYLGTFSTISQLMSEATDRSPKPDPRDLPKPICDDVKDDLDKYSPNKPIGTGRIDGKDYVVYLISKPGRYDTAAATALDTCFLEIGQPYSS